MDSALVSSSRGQTHCQILEAADAEFCHVSRVRQQTGRTRVEPIRGKVFVNTKAEKVASLFRNAILHEIVQITLLEKLF